MAKVQELPTLNQVGNYTAVSNDMMKKYAGKIGIGPIVAWSLIYNRYQSSQGKDSFWDEEHADYYAIFTVKELVNFLGVSATTVNDFLNKLVNEGLLIKTKPKKGFNKANRFFPKLSLQFSKTAEHKPGIDEPIPAPQKGIDLDITDKPESGVSVIKKPSSNHLTLNYVFNPYTSYSFNTKRSTIKLTSADRLINGQKQKKIVSTSFKEVQDINDFEVAKHSLEDIGIPKVTVALLAAYAHNNARDLEMYRTLLLEAKADVRNTVCLADIDYSTFSNEENPLIQENIHYAVQRAFGYIRKACKTKMHAKNYFRSAMRSFYELACDAYSQGKTRLTFAN